MNISEIREFANEFVTDPKYGFLHAADTAAAEFAGMQFFDLPLVGFAAADNEYYRSIIDNDAANIDLAPPEFWLKGAKTVVSFFFPFSEQLRKSNRAGGMPSLGWLHGRVQGQQFMQAFAERFRDLLISEAHDALIPQIDERFWQNIEPRYTGADGRTRRQFSCNWSERHVAFGAGLGTFGLAGNLITEKGTAGRFVSVVTTAQIEGACPIRLRNELPEIYGNCTMCKLCIKRCPNGAIGELGNKVVPKCFEFMGIVSRQHKPLHGCGMCQVAIPCEFRNPAQKV